jgi:hypothetical protein
MAKFKKKPDTSTYEVEQYTGPESRPKGMCGDVACGASRNRHVHTAHNQTVDLEAGDWVMPEPDGRGYYPIKPDIFKDRYEAIEDIFEQTAGPSAIAVGVEDHAVGSSEAATGR